jgi:hypothetical protein
MRMLCAPLLVAATGLSCMGCQSAFERYYVPASVPPSHAPVEPERVRIVECGESAPEQVRQRLYPDATLVGTSRFTGPDLSRDELQRFAGEIGANLAIWSARYLDTLVYTDYDREKHSQTTTVTTGKGKDTTVTRVETERTEVLPRAVTRTRYRHDVLYLCR